MLQQRKHVFARRRRQITRMLDVRHDPRNPPTRAAFDQRLERHRQGFLCDVARVHDRDVGLAHECQRDT